MDSYIEKKLTEKLRPAVITSLREELRETVEGQLRAELEAEYTKTRDDLVKVTKDALRVEMEEEVRTELKEELRSVVEDTITLELEQKKKKLETELTKKIAGQLLEELRPVVRDDLREELYESVRLEIKVELALDKERKASEMESELVEAFKYNKEVIEKAKSQAVVMLAKEELENRKSRLIESYLEHYSCEVFDNLWGLLEGMVETDPPLSYFKDTIKEKLINRGMISFDKKEGSFTFLENGEYTATTEHKCFRTGQTISNGELYEVNNGFRYKIQ